MDDEQVAWLRVTDALHDLELAAERFRDAVEAFTACPGCDGDCTDGVLPVSMRYQRAAAELARNTLARTSLIDENGTPLP